MGEQIQKSLSELWRDYDFLTMEMAKMLGRQDMDVFHELMSQRERLQTFINQLDGKEFLSQVANQNLLRKIAIQENAIANSLRRSINQAQQQQQVSQSYDQFAAQTQNYYLDRKG